MYPSVWGREAWEFSWKELTSQSKCSFCIYYFQFWVRSCSESSFLSKDLPLASPWESWGAASLTSIFKWRIKVSSISVALLQPQLVTGNWSQVSGHKPPICTALFFLYTAEGPLLLKTTSLVYVFSDKEKETRNYFKGVRIRNTLPSLHGYAPLKQHKLSPINKQKQAHKILLCEPISLKAKLNNAHTDLFSLQPVISFLKHVDLSLPSYFSSEHSTSVLVCIQPTSLNDPMALSGNTSVLKSFHQFSWTLLPPFISLTSHLLPSSEHIALLQQKEH